MDKTDLVGGSGPVAISSMVPGSPAVPKGGFEVGAAATIVCRVSMSNLEDSWGK